MVPFGALPGVGMAGDDMGVSPIWGYHFEGPNNKDFSILGSILGSPYFGKLPYSARNLIIVSLYAW